MQRLMIDKERIMNNNLAQTRSWQAVILTLFPEIFPGPLASSLIGRALEDDIWKLNTLNIRDFSNNSHNSVDDEPFGGGPGMVLRPDIIDSALTSATNLVDDSPPIIYLTPRGRPLEQKRVKKLAVGSGVILLCGRYEGIDQRVLDVWSIEEISLGDFVLSGGETAALALLDAVVRLLPGVIGSERSLVEESFENDLLEYPHYTRPATWRDKKGNENMVPEILYSGHHRKIKEWRHEQAEKVTRARRPDLWKKYIARN